MKKFAFEYCVPFLAFVFAALTLSALGLMIRGEAPALAAFLFAAGISDYVFMIYLIPKISRRMVEEGII